MPTYVYRCSDCANVFEEFQRITADPGATCPSCGDANCTRQITGGAFHLKGSGWYASDYGKPASKPAEPVKADATDAKAEPPKAATPNAASKTSTDDAPASSSPAT